RVLFGSAVMKHYFTKSRTLHVFSVAEAIGVPVWADFISALSLSRMSWVSFWTVFERSFSMAPASTILPRHYKPEKLPNDKIAVTITYATSLCGIILCGSTKHFAQLRFSYTYQVI